MPQIAVVGAGAVGLATAYHLVQRGEDVAVYDAQEPGRGCSFANGGWIAPAHVAPLPGPDALRMAIGSLGRRRPPLYVRLRPSADAILWLYRFGTHCTPKLFARGCDALAQLSTLALPHLRELQASNNQLSIAAKGMLHVFQRSDAARVALDATAVLDRKGIAVPDRVLTRAELLQLEPAVGERAQAGLLFPAEECVDPRDLTAALTAAIRREGGSVHEGTTVTDFSAANGEVTAICCGSTETPVSAVVLAAGVWTRGLAARLGVHLPLLVGRGYSVHLRLPTPLTVGLHLSDVSLGLSPTSDGGRLTGVMELCRPMSKPRRTARLQAMLESGIGYVKGWPGPEASTDESAWSGMRPITPDGLPIIDRLPMSRNAYVCTGHGMWGIALALPSGAALANYLTSGRRPTVLEPFNLDRW